MTATTIVGAYDALRARADAQLPSLDKKWQDEEFELPDTPAPFVYFEIEVDPAFIASFGGDRGQNRYRNPSQLNAYVFVPRGWGLRAAAVRGEAVAAAFRSFRSAEISCFEATVHPLGKGEALVPPGLRDGISSNYAAVVVSVDFFFDQIG